MKIRLSAIAACCLALTATVADVAGAAPFSFSWRQEIVPSDRPYFVDFRARAGSITGHTFIVFGRLSKDGRLISIQNADVYPVDHEVGAVVGTIAPVRGEVRLREGDSKRITSINYRRYLTAAEFARLQAAVRHERMVDRQWSLLLFNCNDFAINIARALGLRTPPSLMLPATFVATLRLINGRQRSAGSVNSAWR